MISQESDLQSVITLCQKNERVVRKKSNRSSPLIAVSNALNIQAPIPSSPSTTGGKSISICPINAISNRPNNKEEDTRDAALLLTNVGMLMAKEVNGSLLEKKSTPDLTTSSKRSLLGPNITSDRLITSSAVSSMSTLGILNPSISFTKKWDAYNVEDNSHPSCTISQEVCHQDQVKGVKLSRGKLKEIPKEYDKTSIDLGLKAPNLSSRSIRMRAVSMDFRDSSGPLQSDNMQESEEQLIHITQPMRIPTLATPIVSPPTSPITRSVSQDQSADFGLTPMPIPTIPIPMQVDRALAKKTSARHVDRRKRYLDSSASFKDEQSCQYNSNTDETILEDRRKGQDDRFVQDTNTSTLINYDNNKNTSLKLILRKKFSWKNYPILEAFLIANRAEYLRHSALNYTIQQKNYNNRLTERLLELASENGYVFDKEVFSFVTVRDRIRCYFKSYVQSRKKRGVIIGYAARRAGLLSEKEIEASASRKGKIVVPQCFTSRQQKDA